MDADYEKKRKILETRRTVIREIGLSDLPVLYEIYDGPGITDYMEPLYDWEEEVAYTKTYIQMIYGFYGYGMWVVEESATGKLIGRVGFDDRTLPDGAGGSRRILELGFLIAAEKQRQGFAEEVCRAAIAYMREEYDEDAFTCLIENGNDASIRLVKKLGFSLSGRVLVDKKEMQEWRLSFSENSNNAQKEQ